MAVEEIITTFQLKRGTAARWNEVNPILAQGEPGFELDTLKLKIGDGIRTWKELSYVDIPEIITVDTFADLEKLQGATSIIYVVIEDNKMYRWDETENTYKALTDLSNYYTIEEIDAKIGDIDTALDAIIAIQENYLINDIVAALDETIELQNSLISE